MLASYYDDSPESWLLHRPVCGLAGANNKALSMHLFSGLLDYCSYAEAATGATRETSVGRIGMVGIAWPDC